MQTGQVTTCRCLWGIHRPCDGSMYIVPLLHVAAKHACMRSACSKLNDASSAALRTPFCAQSTSRSFVCAFEFERGLPICLCQPELFQSCPNLFASLVITTRNSLEATWSSGQALSPCGADKLEREQQWRRGSRRNSALVL